MQLLVGLWATLLPHLLCRRRRRRVLVARPQPHAVPPLERKAGTKWRAARRLLRRGQAGGIDRHILLPVNFQRRHDRAQPLPQILHLRNPVWGVGSGCLRHLCGTPGAGALLAAATAAAVATAPDAAHLLRRAVAEPRGRSGRRIFRCAEAAGHALRLSSRGCCTVSSPADRRCPASLGLYARTEHSCRSRRGEPYARLRHRRC